MELKKILKGIEDIKAKGNLDIEITNVESNSKNIQKGSMFVAIKGFDSDGTKYIKDALQAGANTIVIEDGTKLNPKDINDKITILSVPNTRKFVAIASANFFDNPSRKFKLIGITRNKR